MSLNVISRFLAELGVPHTEGYVNDSMRTQPYMDSLFSLSVILDRYKVRHEMVRFKEIAIDRSEYFPMLVSLQGQYVVVTKMTADVVCIVNANGKQQELSMKFFQSLWDGVAIVAEADADSIEPNYGKNRTAKRISGLKFAGMITGAIILLLYGEIYNGFIQDWWKNLVIAVNGGGVYLSYLLIQKELNVRNRMADKICNIIHENDCHKVTDSSGSTFLGLIKLSSVGFGFFSVNIGCLLFVPEWIGWLAVVSFGVLPFTLWSVWYQKFRVKSWCALCLCTLMVMWLQSIIYLCVKEWHGDLSNLYSLVALGALYVLIVLITDRYVGFLKDWKKKEIWEGNFRHLKAEPKVVKAFMDGQPDINISDDGCSSLLFGNPDAPYRITIFSNPLCNPCGRIHEIIECYPGQEVCVQYVMTYFAEDVSILNRYIIAAYFQKGARWTWKMLTEWYAVKTKKDVSFFDNMDLDLTMPEVTAEFNKHKNWIKMNSFYGTPAIMVNRKELTGPYTVEDYVLMSEL